MQDQDRKPKLLECGRGDGVFVRIDNAAAKRHAQRAQQQSQQQQFPDTELFHGDPFLTAMAGK